MLTGRNHFTRQINRMAVLRLLQAEGPRSRIRIATALDLSPSTVSSVVGELLAADVVQ
jgi:DNA-binding Lrp family transcriptional regulator